MFSPICSSRKKPKRFTHYLNKYKIPYGYHYPYSIHKLKAIKNFCIDKNFRNSLLISSQCVSLPIDPNLTQNQLKYITNKINLF